MKNGQKVLRGAFLALAAVSALAVLSSCSSGRLGWGVLLWATDDPVVLPGTVLPVYVRSNIDRVWIVGLPAGARTSSGLERMEVPFAHLELVGNNRARADARAQEFAPLALTYAENLQVGLPIRAHPDNNARRVYRLREGDIIKILEVSERGVPPLGVTGEPLEGHWYRVLTEGGTIGYTFSYRLRLFEHAGGSISADGIGTANLAPVGSDLDLLLSRAWVPESYQVMVNTGRLNLDDLMRGWHFNPGRENNVAQIVVPGVNQLFEYTAIVPSGNRAWRFEGTSLTAQLRSDTNLVVQFIEAGGAVRTLPFVAMAVGVDDLIARENARRGRLFGDILSYGPVFTSSNFGTIAFGADGTFTWNGFDLLVPQHIPRGAQGRGTVVMDLFLAPGLGGNSNGAFTMRFAGSETPLRAMYSIDNQGFRLELVPAASIDGVTVARRSASPMVLFFFADNENVAGAAGADATIVAEEIVIDNAVVIDSAVIETIGAADVAADPSDADAEADFL